MSKHKINLLREKYDLPFTHKPSATPMALRVVAAVVLTGAVFAAVFSYRVDQSGELSERSTRSNIFAALHKLVRADDRAVAGEHEDRTNVLFLGVGGEGHEGPQLSDTMIFASYKPSTDNVGMISLPRDLVVPMEGYGWRKINHANAYGEIEKKGSGPTFAADAVEKITGQKIHYFLRVDFAGFGDLIDDLGGVNLYVERSFSDAQYPILGMETAECGGGEKEPEEPSNYGCRFETITFEQGWKHMEGAEALKYVRSRHGTNGESSDFARSRRQQHVILAVKNKILSAGTLLNPAKVNRIWDAAREHIVTNMDVWELLALANKLQDIEAENITSHVLAPGEASPIYETFFNGAYVLLPKNDDWGLLQTLAQNIFEPSLANAYAASAPTQPKFVSVEIQNGTQVTGLAFHISQMLDGQGFEVKKIGNAAERGFEHTVIYDLTDGKHPEALKELRDFLKAEVTLSAAGWLLTGDMVPREIHLSADEYSSLATDSVDFLVILGDSSANLVRK